MDGMGAADVGGAGFRQPEEPHLALPDQIGDRTRDVLHRNGRIDAVLVEQVDVIGAETAHDPSTAARTVAGRLSRSTPTCLPFSRRKPNLVAITTFSRRPLSPRPSNSSFV